MSKEHQYPIELTESRTTERYVAWFDILGMTTAMLTTPQWAMRFLLRFQRARCAVADRKIIVSTDNTELPERLSAQAFSDSLFLISTEATEEDLYSIIVRSALLFEAAVHYKVPVRAAITVGTIAVDSSKTLFAGAPLVRAYRLAETSDWIGLELEPKVANRASALDLGTEKGPPLLVSWRVPTKLAEPRSSVAINWPALYWNFDARAQSSASGFFHVCFGTGKPYSSLAPPARRKYENTFIFVKYALSLKKPVKKVVKCARRRKRVSQSARVDDQLPPLGIWP